MVPVTRSGRELGAFVSSVSIAIAITDCGAFRVYPVGVMGEAL